MATKRRRKATTKRRKATKRRRPSKKASTKAKRAVRRARTRAASRRKNPAKRKRRRNSWYGQPYRHKWAAKYGSAKPRRRRKTTSKKRRRNPTRRNRPVLKRYNRRRRRRNPGMGGVMKIMTRHALPTALSLYVARLVSGRAAGMVPGLDRIPAQFRGPAIAGLGLGVAHFATKRVAPFKKYRNEIMVGFGINVVDKLLSAFAPENVKSMFGVGEYVQVGGMGEYIAVDGAPPIDDQITLSDYFDVDSDPGLEQDLGQIYADLGAEEDLGELYADLGAADFADRRLGGVTRSAMRAPIARKNFVAPVPERSFTKKVPQIGSGFDNPANLYTGQFSGGFGN